MKPERCPTCQQRMPPIKIKKFSRICRKCGLRIAQDHKWKAETDGEASWFEHKHCDNPASYHSKSDISRGVTP